MKNYILKFYYGSKERRSIDQVFHILNAYPAFYPLIAIRNRYTVLAWKLNKNPAMNLSLGWVYL